MFSEDYVMDRKSKMSSDLDENVIDYIQSRLKERSEFKKNRDYEEADIIRDELRDEYGVSIDDRTREWNVKVSEYSVLGDELDEVARRSSPPAPYDFLVEAEVDEEDNEEDDEDDDYYISEDDEEEEDEDEEDDYFVAGDDVVDSVEEEKSSEIVAEDDEHAEQVDLTKFTVVELKAKLREAGLPVSGKKAELIERLSLAE